MSNILSKGDVITFTKSSQINKRTKFVLITNPNEANQAQLVCLDEYKNTFYNKGDICTMLLINYEIVRKRFK